jgi:hypothetical protein
MKMPVGDIFEKMGTFAIHCWIASSSLLRFVDLDDWSLKTAEDSVLQAGLIARADVVFSYRATACVVRTDTGASNFDDTPTRDEDVFECFARLFPIIDRVEAKYPSPSMSNWARLSWALDRVIAHKTGSFVAAHSVLAVEEGARRRSLAECEQLERRPVPLRPESVTLAGASHLFEHDGQNRASIEAPRSPWAFGAQIRLDPSDVPPGRKWVVLEFGPISQPLGVGVLQDGTSDFVTRMELPVSIRPVEAWLHLQGQPGHSTIVVQNWAQPAAAVELHRVWMVW